MQISRLFEIVYILLEKKRVTAKELAEHFEVSPRTIYRDIEILSGAGIPVYMSKGKGGGVSLLSEFILNKAVITEREKEEILSALKAVSVVKTGEEAITLRKLGSLFGVSHTDWIEVNFGNWSEGKQEEALFWSLKEAITGEKVIRFSYASAKGQVTEREVEPLKLVFRGEAWYLYGYCRLREDFRFFKLKRIKGLKTIDESFGRESRQQIPEDRTHSYGMDRIKIKVKIDKAASYRVYDEIRDYEELADGSFHAEVEFEKNEWLLYYLLSFGQHIEVLEPEEIREWLKEELQKMLERYT